METAEPRVARGFRMVAPGFSAVSAKLLLPGTETSAPESRTEVALTQCLAPRMEGGLWLGWHTLRLGQPLHSCLPLLVFMLMSSPQIDLSQPYPHPCCCRGHAPLPDSGAGLWKRVATLSRTVWTVNPCPPLTVEKGGVG